MKEKRACCLLCRGKKSLVAVMLGILVIGGFLALFIFKDYDMLIGVFIMSFVAVPGVNILIHTLWCQRK